MKVSLIGTGNMGSGFARQLSAAGHQVRVTARDSAKTAVLASQFANVQAVEAAAAGDADVIIVATPYEAAVPALRALGDLTGKVIVDATNPLTPDYMGLTLGHSTSAAEEIARAFPGAKVVKAFNTIFASLLTEGGDLGEGRKATVFIAGDDEQAVQTVKSLAESMGFATQTAGGLKNARYLEPLAGLNIFLGYGAGLGTNIAPAWQLKA